MDSLPSEILCDIFLQSLPERGRPSATASFLILSPLYISHVCRRWRDVSLSYGELWSYFSFEYRDVHETKQRKRVVKVFDAWIHRTNGVGLNFTFWCDFYRSSRNTEDDRAVNHIIATLVAHQQRWKDVDFQWDWEPSSSFRGIKVVDMPMLTSLSLEEVHCTNRPSMCTVYNISSSPRLRKLHLTGQFILEVGDRPFSALTECSVGWTGGCSPTIATRFCVDLLRLSPYMRQFSVRLYRDDFSSQDGTPAEVIHDLDALDLRRHRPLTILDSLTLPALKTLTYYTYMGNSIAEPRDEVFLCFVQRSLPPLIHLVINSRELEADTLIPALRLLPSLEKLCIDHATISTHFFRTLKVNVNHGGEDDVLARQETVICPALKALRLSPLHRTDYSIEWTHELCQMLHSRWAHSKGLQASDIPADVTIGTIRYPTFGTM